MAHFVIEDIYEKSDAFFADSCGFPLIYHAIFFCFVLFFFNHYCMMSQNLIFIIPVYSKLLRLSKLYRNFSYFYF